MKFRESFPGFYLGVVVAFLFWILAIASSRYLEIPYRSLNKIYLSVIILTIATYFLLYLLINFLITKKYITYNFLIFLIWFLVFTFLNRFLKLDLIYALLFSAGFILFFGLAGRLIYLIKRSKFILILTLIVINMILFIFLMGINLPANEISEGSFLYYGSGIDKRDVYRNPEIITKMFDGSEYLQLTGLPKKYRELQWGFGMDNLPLNAKVWYPQEKGKFPLIMMIHGNHFGDRSEEGYDYLGKELSGKDYIFISIDENFLNSDPFLGSLSGEGELRARLILEHLRLWQEWERDANNKFYGRVDLNNITLIGHSKGGEAAVIAAALNEKEQLGFKIRNIIQIAPGVEEPIKLQANYLLILGGYDSDRYTFEGKKQYDKMIGLKSLIYIPYANHVKFNSVWGETDLPVPKSWLLNQQPILSSQKQQDLTKEYISAFLEDGYVESNIEIINPRLMKFDFLEDNYFTEERELVKSVWKEGILTGLNK